LLNTISNLSVIGEPIKIVNTNAAAPDTDPDWAVPLGGTWVNTITTSPDVNRDRKDSLKAWWFNIMINQPRSIEEKMILFWSSHVAIEFSMVGNGLMSYKYLQLLRKYALGNFKALIKEVTLNPAMLVYLNGYANFKTAPDENYARELQELFTLGKGPGSQYTEDDVKAAARVLTGYMVNLQTTVVSFSNSRHDTDPKQFSSFYDNTVINRNAGQAELELDDLISMIFSKEEVSKYLCRKLYRYFVYDDITADTETNIITPLAETFRNNNYEIKPVLNQLFKSEHFFDVLQFGGAIKSPLDFTVGLIRECSIKLPPKSNPQLLYRHLFYLANTFLPSVEQSIGDPINVAGFPAYSQTPFFDRLWVNTDTFIKRQAFTDTMVNTGYSNGGFVTYINPVAVAARMSDPGNPSTLVLDFNKYFLRRNLSQRLLDTIKTDVLLTGQANDNYWTSAWNAYISNPADLNNFSVVNTRLKFLALYFLSRLEEYHLM
jgi:uncharacterized protein (DUF1800 family)